MLLPETHSALIRADDKVELHGAEPPGASTLQRMRAHRSGHAGAGGRRSGHLTAIGHMGACTVLVRSQKVRADNPTVIFRNEDFMVLRKPKGECILPAYLAGQRISIASPNYGVEYRPDCIAIAGLSRTYSWHAPIVTYPVPRWGPSIWQLRKHAS